MKTRPLPSSSPTRDDGCSDCGSCLGRREFLRVGLATAALAALPATLSAATPLRGGRAGAGGEQVRYALPDEDGVQVDRGNEVILMRQGGVVAAFALSCPHERSLLRWRERDGIFQCTKHRSEYSPMGEYQEGRATRNMDRLGIRLEGGAVVVDRGTVYHSDEQPEAWAAAQVSCS